MAKPFSYEEAAAPQSGSFSYEDATGEAPKPAGMIRKIADKGLGFASGAVGATKAIADAAGAGNRVSGALGTANEFLNDNLSPQAKADQQEQSAIMDSAKGQGVWEGVKAGAKAFGVAPVQTAVQGLGSVVPVLAGGLAGLPGAAATGIAMGAGTAKGAIYDRIKKEGGTDEAANQAQSYSGPNTDQIAMGGALGVADALTGVSRIAGGMVRGALGKPVAQAVTTGAERGVIGRMGMGVVGEMPLEAAQGGQEQVAANLAAQRAGYQAGTWDNVASNATLEALASAGPGAAFGAFDKKSALPVPLVPPVEPAPTVEQVPPLQLGNTPDPMISFADGTVARKSEVDKYISGLPPEQQPAARAKLMGLAPQPAKPSEAMGLTPTAAPSLTNAAIIAVDTGASQPTMSAFDQREADRPKSIEGDVAITESGAPITNRLMAQKAAERKSSETGQSWQPIQLGAKQFVIRPMASDTAQQSVEATPLQTQTVQPDQNTEQPQTDAVQGQGTEAKGLDQGSLADATPKQQAPKVTGKPQPTTLGTQTNAVAGPGFGVNTARGMSNVKDAAQGTDTQATQAPGEAPKAVAGDAAASSELPATGSGTVEGRGLNQTLAQAEQAPVATNDVANQPWSMTKDTFDSWPRAFQWGFARQQGIKPESRNRDAEQEKNSHILATTPGGRGGDKAPDTFFSDIRNLHQEIVEKAIAEGKPVPAEVLADYPDLQNSSANKVGRKDSAQLAQPESVVLPTQNATNNTPTAPTGAPMGVTSVAQPAQPVQQAQVATENVATSQDELQKQRKDRAQKLANGIEVGDTIVTADGDRIEIIAVNKDKDGNVTAVLPKPIPGLKDSGQAFDLSSINSLLAPYGYFDADGNRKTSEGGIVEKKKPKTPAVTTKTEQAPTQAPETARITDSAIDGVPAAGGNSAVEGNGVRVDGVIRPSSAPQATGTSSTATDIDKAAHAAATSPLNALAQPTDGQKKAGNYAKGHVMLGGLDLSIENPAGSIRSGNDKNGKPWSNTLQHHYGYIKGTMGNDKDHVDLFVNPKTPLDYSGQVFVIDQVHPETGRFDEHKVMVGFPNILAAKAAYMSNYAKGWKGMKAVTPMAFNDFKSWVKAGPKNVPLAQDKSVSQPTEKPSAQATKTQQVQAERPPQGTTAATTDKPAADAGVAAAGKAEVAKPKKPAGGKTLRNSAYDKNPMLTFLATHGLFHDKTKPNSQKSEYSPDKGIMVMGYGPVFKRTGKQPSDLVVNAIQDGYLPVDGTVEQLDALIRRAIGGEKISPMYAEGVAEQIAEQSFAEHLAQQQEAAQDEDYDPFQSIGDMEMDLDDFNVPGYDAESDAIKLEVNALLALANDQGVDTEETRLDASYATAEQSEQAYYEALRSALTTAIAKSNRLGGENIGAQSNAPVEEGLTAPTRADVLAQQERTDNAQALDDRAQIDAEASRQTLTRQTAPEQRTDTSGDMFAMEKAQAEIDKRNAGAEKAKDPNQAGMFDEPVLAPARTSPEILRAQADLQAALADLGDIFGKNTRLNMMPEQEAKILPVMVKLFDAAFRLGYHKFMDAAKFTLDKIRAALGDAVADDITLEHLQGAYISMSSGKTGVDGIRKVSNIEAKAEIESHTAQTDNERNGEPTDAPSTNTSVERDSPVTSTEPAVGDSIQDDATGTSGRPGKTGGRTTGGAGRGQQDGAGVPTGGAAVGGERGDQRVSSDDGKSELTSIVTGADFSEPGGDSGITGVPVEPIAASQVDATSDRSPTGLKAGIERVRANKIPVTTGDIDNIRATLPQLLPGQQEDVQLAEKRFAKPDGYGMLFTNGTGTGKTFSGLGVVKRYAMQGKTNTLIVVPDTKIAADWIESAKLLGLDATSLDDTTTHGKGIVVTTYANLGMNDSLAKRQWDVVIADEAHSLMQAADGEPTSYLYNLRAITYHPDGAGQRHSMLNRDKLDHAAELGNEITALEKMAASDSSTALQRKVWEAKSEKLQAELGELRKELNTAQQAIRDEVDAGQGAGRTRLVALSATPFAYEKTIDWANGYLFDYNDGQTSDRNEFRGYNSGSNKDRYMMQHFGYSMRYNKMTRPDANVDSGLMQRQWNANLKKSGALSGRMLDVVPDYDRRFILVESAIGNRIDEALEWISEQRQAEKGQGPFATLSDAINEQFKYLQKRYLLEAIKATEVVPIVKQHMKMGRKVVVFHDYKKGGGFNPFVVNASAIDSDRSSTEAETSKQFRSALDAFNDRFSDLVNYPFSAMRSPIDVFSKELPGVLLINGDEKKADLHKRYKQFQDDNSGPLVMLVQSAKNKGWSGHDTTGKHQRVLINLGQPTAPTLAIQQEGRIYRTGQASDAIMRYMNTGTNWERWTFASTIATRASTAENLGMGEMARALKDSFIQSFEESDTFEPGHEGEGKGGKERDKAANDAITAYDRAKTFYFGRQKKNSRTKAQEGVDYFATPEPVGLKMVQWLDARGGESTLEPSAGHGAIARWLPDNTNRTAIEPSFALRSKLALVMEMKETGDRILSGTFEDHHVSNKYDGIVMNPPFGTAGRTAIDHLAKAATHLRDGGRIVALLPDGPSANAKFDKWFYESSEKPVKPLMTHPTHGDIFRGDIVKISGFGNSREMTVEHIDGPKGGPNFVRAKGANVSSGINVTAIDSVAHTGARTESFKPAEGLSLVAAIKLPAVTFERAGTAVATRIVVIEKNGANVMTRDRDYSDITDIKELFDKLENLDFAARAKPIEVAPAEPAKAEKPAAAAKPAKVTANAGDEVTIGGTKYEIEIYTTNAGKEKRGVWMASKAEATKYSARAFTHSSNKGKWFVDEYWFPKDVEIIKPNAPAAFSLGASSTGLPHAKVISIVNAIRSQWENSPDVVVAASMDDPVIPQSVRDYDQLQKSQGAQGEPEGFIYRGKVYLIANQLPEASDVIRVLFHEALGHKGLRGAYGDELKPILQQVATMRRKEVSAKASQYGLDMSKESDRLAAAEEVLAEMAQTRPEIGFVTRAVAAIRAWLRKHVPGFSNLAMKDSEIVAQFLLPARRFIEGRGEKQRGTAGQLAFGRGKNGAMTNTNVVGNQGGRSADDSTPGGYNEKDALGDDGQYRYQFQANKEGGQTVGNQMRVERWKDGSGWAQYTSINGKPETLTRVRDNLNEVLPSDEAVAKGWAIPVQSFSDAIAINHSKTSDSNESTAPDSGGAMFSRTMGNPLTDAANNTQEALKNATVTDLLKQFGNRLGDFRGLGLQTLGRRQLVDLYAGDLPQMESYSRMVAQMDADKNESGAEADALATDWGKLKDERQLAELMHDATLAQIDPDKAFVEGDNRDFYDALKHGFDRLTPEAKAAYRKARDMYSEHNDKVRDAIRERIMRSEMSSAKKQALLTKMEGEFFKKVKGVYFPLARFGQYVTIVKDSRGEVVSANRSETMNEAEATRKILLTKFPPARGFKVSKVLKDKEFNAARDGVGRGFMADLFETLDKTNAGEELTDAISQLYLAALPDLSWAKHGIHRKGTPGFSQDARRAFAQNMFHGARYLAKLRYADRLQTNLDDMQEHIASKADDDGFDSVKAQQVVDEMVKRHDTMMNPQTNPISTALTSFGFVFHLGLSPASALVNLSQTALVAYPVMGAKWGFGKASAALMNASRQAAGNKNDISKALSGEDLEAYNEAVRAGVIDVTMAHDLAGIAQGEDSKVSAKIRPVMKAASFLFHHAEKFNRQVTFVASYRLARETGAGFQAAYDQAVKATYDGHFDYSASNRPRVMQGNVAKVVLLFKQYAQNMIYTLTRQAQLSLNAATPAERAEARKALGGLLVSHALAAGALGLPMVGMLLSAASAIGGDDDEPWDAKVALQNMLADTLGKKPAEVFAHGLSRLTPWDISGRVGLDKLLLPDVQEGLEGADAVKNWMAAALGPVAGIAVNAGKGMQDMANGQYARGLESMLPSALRSPLKAYRYGTEGNIDKSGVAINDEIGAAGVAGQALGFSPSEARLAQEGKSAIYSADRAIQARRSSLTRQFALAAMAKDQDGMTDARKDIARFNEKNPKARITPINLMQSVRARRKRIEQAEQGVYLPKKRQDAIEAGRFALAE